MRVFSWAPPNIKRVIMWTIFNLTPSGKCLQVPPIRLAVILLVFYPHKAESIGRGYGSGGCSVFCVEDIGHFFCVGPAYSDLYERSGDIAHHIVQEPISLYINMQPIVFV